MQAGTGATDAPRLEMHYADVVGSIFKVDYGSGHFVIHSSGNKIEVFESGKQQVLGLVRRGSSWSGSIWQTGKCIGEYTREPADDYVVIPVEKERRRSEEAIKLDPLIYLLRQITSRK